MRRPKKPIAEGGVDLGVIITPMLDMAFQLLAFFILTYQPPASEAAMDGSLMPAANGISAPSTKETLTVMIQASPAGEPSAIYVKQSAESKLIGKMQSADDLTAALQKLAQELTRFRGQDLTVHLEAHRSLHYGHVIAVQDVIRAAGFTHIAYRPVNGSNK